MNNLDLKRLVRLQERILSGEEVHMYIYYINVKNEIFYKTTLTHNSHKIGSKIHRYIIKKRCSEIKSKGYFPIVSFIPISNAYS